MTPSHGSHGHNFSSPEIVGSQDSVTVPYCLWRHTLLPRDHGQSRLRHRAIGPHIFLPRDHGLSILRHWCVLFIATQSSTAIMGSQGAVLFMFTHHFPLRSWAVKTRHRAIWPLIFLPSPRSWAVNTSSLVCPIYCNTHSSTAIMGSQGAVLFMATHTLPLRLWAVKAPSPGHLAAHCPFPRSWAVNTPSLVRTVNCNTHSSTAIMGSQEAVLFVDTHTLQLRSWAVKTPLPGH
ncbi:hypothetical protein Bpfe_002342 [Biomphalaria pfeifferi]|uniref:Uncharacterized protein n=1 Tax=Biomphalaria pfeifferi TaxID=112525 RepID=A0AAD8C9E3_BIOPF|nr:hypothetical protein Bpfe_002342 [Biomphalaria pfeifferi]